MLVLSRKQGESIRIADNITVTVVELGRGRVRIGISAPANVPVHREEILTRAATAQASLNSVAAGQLMPVATS